MYHSPASRLTQADRIVPGDGSCSASPRLIVEDQYQQTKKRQKLDTSSSTFAYSPRKRAITACRTCRHRKTKCNNARPACALCVRNDTECVYDGPEHSEQSPGLDASNGVVLDHLKQIIDRLDGSVIPLLATQNRSLASTARTGATLPTAQENKHVDNARSEVREDHYLTIPSSRTSPDATLQWPVFENKYPPNFVIRAVLNDRDGCEDLDTRGLGRLDLQAIRSRGAKLGIGEDGTMELVNRYLNFVHVKNPIVDASMIRQHARVMMEEGPGWNDESCLVLIACALGSLAKPYHLGPILQHPEPGSSSIEDSRTDLEIAESYYTLARRRIGLLKDSIVETQCYFLSAVYLMYTFRPLDAWHNFHRASTTFYLYRTIRGVESASVLEATRHVEQRLYWSCFKSECELRVQMPLPASGIADLHFPDLFPSPPWVSSPTSEELEVEHTPSNWNRTPGSHASSSRSAEHSKEQEKSWFYYLTEIAFRRIGNRILNIFYGEENPDCSSMDILDMIRMTSDFERELDQWYWGLPDVIRWDNDDLYIIPSEELTYLVGMRLLEIKLWLYRPFVFHAIHSFSADPHLPLIQPLIDKAMFNCSRFIEATAIKHRHHGTWMVLNAATMASLTIIAAANSGRLAVPEGWRHTVELQILTLKYWEQESPDMQKARILLQDMLAKTRSSE
ncbi:hypothetical protein DL98DRAFT_37513 [Cadophora sp. DSE1049]|nr:hypothetical protein DL98DRAFT_37513 [Cadophora sp. DSE1049]